MTSQTRLISGGHLQDLGQGPHAQPSRPPDQEYPDPGLEIKQFPSLDLGLAHWPVKVTDKRPLHPCHATVVSMVTNCYATCEDLYSLAGAILSRDAREP